MAKADGGFWDVGFVWEITLEKRETEMRAQRSKPHHVTECQSMISKKSFEAFYGREDVLISVY